MSGFFSYYNDDAGNVRNIAGFGGGGLLDIGCYLVNTARIIFGAEPSRVSARWMSIQKLGVDRLTSMVLDFSGRQAIGTCRHAAAAPYQRVAISERRGRIEIEIRSMRLPDRPCRIAVDRTGDVHGSGVEMIAFDTCNQFTIQAEEFSRAILENQPSRRRYEDAVANMACIGQSSARHAAADGKASQGKQYEEH